MMQKKHKGIKVSFEYNILLFLLKIYEHRFKT